MISRATLADLDRIEEIERHSFPRPWPRASFEAELAREHARITVVRDPDVIAFINYWIVVGELHIHSIAVHPDRRRAGVAGTLVAHALAEGRAAGCTLATLEVRISNRPAIALYERAGFRTITKRAAYYQDNGEDALIMTCALSE